MTDIKKSISSVLNERITSPLYGTLILSWLGCNWQIIYLSVFVSEDQIKENKIDYILSHYNNINNLLYFPLASTVVIIAIMPFIGNGAYWLSLIFNKWRHDKKNEIEKTQLLTLGQSIQLRELIAEQEKRFDNLLSDKNSEIKQLELHIEELKRGASIKTEFNLPSNEKQDALIRDMSSKVAQSAQLKADFETLNLYIQGGFTGLANKINSDSLSFFLSNDIIESQGKGMYVLTHFGKNINKSLMNEKFK